MENLASRNKVYLYSTQTGGEVMQSAIYRRRQTFFKRFKAHLTKEHLRSTK